ncbi:MAG TPA: CBS domain-containing protein [Polyangiaceae bacterium]|nr:CBS domain-containing protein [Polyangiaceae bacterium]
MATIRSIMTKDLITVQPTTALGDAVKLLIEHGITGLPVVDGAGHIAGVLSEKDLLKAFYEDAKTVDALMTKDPETVGVDSELVEVFDILMTNSFRRILVHENGKLVGLVSRSDLMPVVLEALLERVR